MQNIKINNMQRGDYFLRETVTILEKAGDSYEFDAKIVHKINRGC